MKAAHHLIVALLVVFGFGASLLLIPQERQLALMNFRSKDYSMAREKYERLLSSGDLSASVVMPLCELYLQCGDISSAVSLMERFVQKHPGSADALRRLGTYYQYAQRPSDYLTNLEELSHFQPSARTLLELSDNYNFTAQYVRQIATLKNLVRLYPDSIKEYEDLAKLQASQGLIADAVVTLRELVSRHPASVDSDTQELFISLLLDSGRPEGAAQQAMEFLSHQPEAEAAARFAGLMHFKGQPALALRLLHPFERMAAAHPALLSQLVQLEIANGQTERAFQRLQELYNSGRLPQEEMESLIDLALNRKDHTLAFNVALSSELSGLPEWMLSTLAGVCLERGYKDSALNVSQRLGADYLEGHPLLAAQLAVAGGDTKSAQTWVAKLGDSTGLPAEQKLAVANLYFKLGLQTEAFNLLSILANSKQTPDSALVLLADLFIQRKNAKEGFRMFETLRSQRHSLQIEQCWVKLGAAAGRTDLVSSWLKAQTSIDKSLLTDLYFIASDDHLPSLALTCAEKLYVRDRTKEKRLWLAKALLSSGRPAEAIPHFKALLGGDSLIDENYIASLIAVSPKDPEMATVLREYLTDKLKNQPLTDKKQEELVYILLDLRAYDAVLPILERFAQNDGAAWLSSYIEAAVKTGEKPRLAGFLKRQLERPDLPSSLRDSCLYALLEQQGPLEALPYLHRMAGSSENEWVPGYEEALRKLGRTQELISFWKTRLCRENISTESKRSIGYGLLELGEKNSALEIFLDLAKTAPPQSKDVLQVLYLCGPRPKPRILEWIKSRAEFSAGEVQAVWLDYLINAGAAQLAVEVVRKHEPEKGQQTAVLDSYIRALAITGDKGRLAPMLDREVKAETGMERLRRLAQFSRQADLNEAALRGYLKIVALDPDDPEALKWTGILAYSKADYSLARRCLARLISAGKGDFECKYYYGGILAQEKNNDQARAFYELAREEIQASSPKSYAMRVTEALLLQRLGRWQESLAAFDSLLKERPGDKNLRADYATALMEKGRYQQAQGILRNSDAGLKVVQK